MPNYYDNPVLYIIAEQVCHANGMPYTDPRTGKTSEPGKPQMPSETFNLYQALLTNDEDRANYLWLYEATRNGAMATVIMGTMMAIAAVSPTLTLIEVLREVRKIIYIKEI